MKDKQSPVVTNLVLTKRSTHKKRVSGKQVHMYTVTFQIGQRKYAQTKHMTEAQAEAFTPSIELVMATKQKGLQKSLFRAKDGKIVYTEK